jgi:hypothetical protein
METIQQTRSTLPASQDRRPGKKPIRDLIQYAKGYVHEKPQVAAMWSFGLGLLLGWKLKR